MRRTPGAECRCGVVARLGVDDGGALGVQRDGQPEREEAPEVPERPPIDPLGQDPVLDAEPWL